MTIHRPEKGNSLAPDVLEEIEGLFAELSSRTDVNVIVLTGGEKIFSAGFALMIIRKLEKVSNEAYTTLFHRAYRAIMFCDQPVIALSLTPVMDPLWRIIGLGRAKEVALTGRIYDAREAERMGYVSKVFPEGELLSSVMEIARTMATYDRGCLKETKQLGNTVLSLDIDGAMRTQEWLFRTYIGSEENHVRIDALLESMKKE